MDYRKLAKIFKGSIGFYIWRKTKNEYWITDTYFLIKLDRPTFCKMKAKYSSYTKTPYIEDLKVGEKIEIYRNSIVGNRGPDIQSVLDEHKKAKDALMTKLLLFEDDTYYPVYVWKGQIGIVQKKYIDILGYEKKFKTVDLMSPLFVYDKNDLIALIMPIRPGTLYGFIDNNGFKALKGALNQDRGD